MARHYISDYLNEKYPGVENFTKVQVKEIFRDASKQGCRSAFASVWKTPPILPKYIPSKALNRKVIIYIRDVEKFDVQPVLVAVELLEKFGARLKWAYMDEIIRDQFCNSIFLTKK